MILFLLCLLFPALASAQTLDGFGKKIFSTDGAIHTYCTNCEAVPGGAGLTDAELRASPVPIAGTLTAITDPVGVTGQFWQATQPVSGAFFQATQPVSLASMPSTPVTGTFWQATQPVSGAFFQATQPVSLAVAPTTPVTGTFWQATQPVSGTFWQATQPVSGTFWQATQPVSGTVTISNAYVLDATYTGRMPAGASPADNETNTNTALSRIGTYAYVFDGSAWDRWTGAVSQSGTWNITNISGTVSLPTGAATLAEQQAQTTALQLLDNAVSGAGFNVTQVGGTNAVNGGLAGSLATGGTAANNAAITQNPVLTGCEALSSQPAAATTGNQRRCVSGLDGVVYFREGGPILFSCNLTAIGTTLTQCQAAPGAGLSLYITDIIAISNTTTAGLHTLRFGTGSNCATGPGNLFFTSASALLASPANTSIYGPSRIHYHTPIKVTANNAVCVLGVATNTTNIQVNGYTAP